MLLVSILSHGQAVIERAKCTLKEMFIKQKGRVKILRDRINNALLTLTFLNVGENGATVAERHWVMEKKRGTRSTNVL